MGWDSWAGEGEEIAYYLWFSFIRNESFNLYPVWNSWFQYQQILYEFDRFHTVKCRRITRNQLAGLTCMNVVGNSRYQCLRWRMSHSTSRIRIKAKNAISWGPQHGATVKIFTMKLETRKGKNESPFSGIYGVPGSAVGGIVCCPRTIWPLYCTYRYPRSDRHRQSVSRVPLAAVTDFWWRGHNWNNYGSSSGSQYVVDLPSPACVDGHTPNNS